MPDRRSDETHDLAAHRSAVPICMTVVIQIGPASPNPPMGNGGSAEPHHHAVVADVLRGARRLRHQVKFGRPDAPVRAAEKLRLPSLAELETAWTTCARCCAAEPPSSPER
jgi:hypothetical protein